MVGNDRSTHNRRARKRSAILLIGSMILITSFALAQRGTEPVDTGRAMAVPRFIRYTGTLMGRESGPRMGSVGVEFAIWRDKEGGVPLWSEIQNLDVDLEGRFGVLLGVTKSDGVPPAVLGSGEPRWLSVREVEGMEQPRQLLVSVPYALRAEEAATLGGIPADEFVLKRDLPQTKRTSAADGSSGSASHEPVTQSVQAPAAGVGGPAAPSGPTTFSGTTATNIVAVQQLGTGKGLVATTTSGVAVAATGGSQGVSGSGAKLGVAGLAKGAAGVGVQGQSTDVADATGADIGVQGIAANSTGAGVSGSNTATSGVAIGVAGSSSSVSGIGVQGKVTAPNGQAVYGINNATTGGAAGVWGSSSSPSGVGVQGNVAAPTGTALMGFNNATTGVAAAVAGISASPNGVGVQGNVTAPGGNAVAGYNNATSGFAVGVNAFTASPAGAALNASNGGGGLAGQFTGNVQVYGTLNANGTTGVAIQGNVVAPSGTAVIGYNNSTTGYATAVAGISASPDGVGVQGNVVAPNGSAVSGYNTATSGPAAGVTAFSSSPSGAALSASNGGGGLAGQFTGNVQVNGNLSVSGTVTSSSSLTCHSVVQNFGPAAVDLSCSAGEVAVAATCGPTTVLNGQTPDPPGGSWASYLTPSADAATGVHCYLGGGSAQANLRCCRW